MNNRIKAKLRDWLNSFAIDDESEKLNKELNERILKIKRDNYNFIVNDKLIPYYQEVYHLNEIEAWGASHALFLSNVECGKIDCLNSLNYEWKGLNDEKK